MATDLELTHFSLEVGDDGVATVLFDVPDAGVNTLSPALMDDFERVLGRLEDDEAIRAVVLGSGKPDGFIAGADLEWLEETSSAEEAAAASREGQRILARLEALHRERGKPVVAAIHGACLGGGLEVALACSARLCSDDRGATQLGQPEVKVGLIPGAGGTQRLPRLIGLTAALDLILTGRSVRPGKARRLGLVDEVVPRPVLLEAARRRARTGLAPDGERTIRLGDLVDPGWLRRLALEENPVGRRVVFEKAHRDVLEETRGNYPAPEAALEAVRIGVEDGPEAGYAAEADRFGRLAVGPEAKALISIFFATQQLKKDRGVGDREVEPRPVGRIGVLGGGLMGGGIAAVTVQRAGVPVRIKEVDREGALRGLRYVRKALDRDVSRRRRSPREADRLMHLVTATTDYSGFGTLDLVIEAVFEDLDLKRSVLREVEEATREDTIFASNTSAIPIASIAEASSRPETVIGMHYFSPAERMPLLEVVVTEQTADWVTATCVAFGKRQGKTVIVVRDGTGFYTSRILAPYMNEAVRLVSEGADVERIDRVLGDFGFPIGPITLLDEVGIDVAAKVAREVEEAFGERLVAPGGLESFLAEGRKGKKAGKGFYAYRDGKRTGVDEAVYGLLRHSPVREVSDLEIRDRTVLAMADEAVRCLAEGILRSPQDGDVGAVFGLGFPPYTGGPFSHLDRIGAAEAVARLEELAERHGDRLAPSDLLREHAVSERPFRG